MCTVAEAHDGREVNGLCAITDTVQASVGTDGTLKLWRIVPTPEAQDRVSHLYSFTESSGEPLYGVRYNGRERLFTYGESDLWRTWRFTQDMHPLDLTGKLK